MFSLFFFPCTDVFPEFGQSCPFIRNGRSSGPTCFSRQIAEFHGRKRHTYHPMSDHFEKPSRSLPTVPVYQGTGRLLRGKLKVPNGRFKHPPKKKKKTPQPLFFTFLVRHCLLTCLLFVCFQCTKQKTWKDIAAQLGIGASSSGAYTLKKHYGKNLLPFECYYDRGGVDPAPILAQVIR